jgi:hypothetical protein
MIKRRKYMKIGFLSAIGSSLIYKESVEPSMSVSLNTTSTENIPENWTNPVVNYNFDEFKVETKDIDTSKPLYLTISAGMNSKFDTIINRKEIQLSTGNGTNNISDKIPPVNLMSSDEVSIGSSLQSGDFINIDMDIKLELGDITLNVDTTVKLNIGSTVITEADEYTFTDASTYVQTRDVSSLDSIIEVTLEGAEGGNGGGSQGSTNGGNGATVVANIDVSNYDELTIAPGQSGSNGGEGISSGGGGYSNAGRGAGSTEIRANGERLVYAGGGGGGGGTSNNWWEENIDFGGGGGAPGGLGGSSSDGNGNDAEGTGNGGNGGVGDDISSGGHGGIPDDSELPDTVTIDDIASSEGTSYGDGRILLFSDKI